MIFPGGHSVIGHNDIIYVFSKPFDEILAHIYDDIINEIMCITEPYLLFNDFKNCIVNNDRLYLFDDELECIIFDIDIKSKAFKCAVIVLFPDYIHDEYLTFEILKDEKTNKILALGNTN